MASKRIRRGRLHKKPRGNCRVKKLLLVKRAVRPPCFVKRKG
jgi:hypothetical protein